MRGVAPSINFPPNADWIEMYAGRISELRSYIDKYDVTIQIHVSEHKLAQTDRRTIS